MNIPSIKTGQHLYTTMIGYGIKYVRYHIYIGPSVHILSEGEIVSSVGVQQGCHLNPKPQRPQSSWVPTVDWLLC